MTAFQVTSAEVVRELPAKDNFPAKDVVHWTFSQNGTSILATSFEKKDFTLPAAGSTVEGELGDNDNFDKERRKFRRAGAGGGGGPRGRSPAETRAIQRQHSQEMALRYVAAKVAAGKLDNFTFDDVRKLTDAFENDLRPPTPASTVPADTSDLPDQADVGENEGERIPF